MSILKSLLEFKVIYKLVAGHLVVSLMHQSMVASSLMKRV